MVPDNLNTLNYPIETEEAQTFWASKHKCNKMKSIIAFSLSYENANDNLRRYGYKLGWRKRALLAFGKYVNKPDMRDIPFSPLSTPWWDCMPFDDIPADLALWIDAMDWRDSFTWDSPYKPKAYVGDDYCTTC